MKNRQLKFLLGFLVFTTQLAYNQTSGEFLSFELSIQKKFKQLRSCRDDDMRIAFNDSIYKEVKDWIALNAAYEYEFDTLKSIGHIKSDDGLIKLITWNLPLMEGYNLFFGFLQYKTKNQIETVELKYNEDIQYNLGDKTVYPNNWYGALYYQILANKYKGEIYYTLLGFIPNDLFTSKKVIDVLNIPENGLVTFGKPIFQTSKGLQSRIIFEYSARVVMKLSFNQKMDMIVFDHLSPSSPNYNGRYQFYGPDFSYDGLKFEKGFWQEHQNIDIEY